MVPTPGTPGTAWLPWPRQHIDRLHDVLADGITMNLTSHTHLVVERPAPAGTAGSGAGAPAPHESAGPDLAVVVYLTGDLDLSSRAHALALVRQVELLSVRSVVLDLSGIDFIDCVGLGVLLRAADQLGGRLRLRSPSALVVQLLALTGTDRQVTVADPGLGLGGAPGGASVGTEVPPTPVTADGADRPTEVERGSSAATPR